MNRRKNIVGFTLVELLVTISVVALMSAFAVPAFNGFLQNNRTITSSNSFLKALTVARSEAAKRNTNVSLCTSLDGLSCQVGASATEWESGWLIFADTDSDGIVDANEEVVIANPGLAANFTLRDSSGLFPNIITFIPTGETSVNAIPAGDVFRLCRPDVDLATSRNIDINNVGRARVVKGVTACP